MPGDQIARGGLSIGAAQRNEEADDEQCCVVSRYEAPRLVAVDWGAHIFMSSIQRKAESIRLSKFFDALSVERLDWMVVVLSNRRP